MQDQKDERDVVQGAQQPRLAIERLPAVLARTGLSRSALYELIKKSEFVQPIPLTKRSVGFLSSEVDSWILARVANRSSAVRR